MASRLCVRKLSVVVHIQPLESLEWDPLESLTFVHIVHMKGSIMSSYRYERSQKAVLANEEDGLWVGEPFLCSTFGSIGCAGRIQCSHSTHKRDSDNMNVRYAYVIRLLSLIRPSIFDRCLIDEYQSTTNCNDTCSKEIG